MPDISLDSIFAPLLRLPDVIKSIPDILRNPAANPVSAVILLALALLIVIIILLSIMLAIMRPSPEDEQFLAAPGEYEEYEEYEEGEYEEHEGEEPTQEQRGRDQKSKPAGPRSFASWLTIASVSVLVLAGAWIVAGITTSSSDVCVSCHTDTVHAKAPASDPHAKVECVSCHESGGLVARVTVNLATRAQHAVRAQANSKFTASYGSPVASDGCLGCHWTQIGGTVRDVARGLRMSHKEPLAAGAQCVECHALTSGAVSAQTVGMSPCLRCHNGKVAKSACAECHEGSPSRAIRVRIAEGSMADAQVPNPRCNGCHFNMTRCNACHGISMPHTTDFKRFAHARAASIDIWSKGLKTCSKCHYPGHNYCSQPGCHSAPFPSHPSPLWREMHGRSSWSKAQQTCTCHEWNPLDHNGMLFCQICHARKPRNALP